MQLTQFSDYALRVLLYLAAHPDGASVGVIARSYRISHHHLAKVVQRLADLGLVASTRGRGGGLKLAVAPEEINIGALIRRTEPHLDLVECFDPATNTCPIAPACGLKGALAQAKRAFLTVLDGYTVASIAGGAEQMVGLWATARDGADRIGQPIDPAP
ncbi:RrF2 family transcriptional regulator [Tundrisphaera sp. TA3]|uniref:RrF2 family transcriptional regulator n=1 Tax=Tundrisphaera sp. TA3 TaxID=3435775 RepID=UPI003EBD7C37